MNYSVAAALRCCSAYRLAAARSRATGAAARSVALDTPTLFQWARVHRIETELIDQTGDLSFGVLIVAGDGQCSAILRASRPPVGGELTGVDMFEGLHDLRGREVRLQEFGRSGRLIVVFDCESRWLASDAAPHR
jgi:hypothetical protein